MIESIQNFNPVILALIAGIFTWGMTALGSLSVFFTKKPSRKLLDSMFGFAAGVMLAASFWSLLAPSIEMSTGKAIAKWFPAAVGFMLGSGFILVIDRLLPHLHFGFPVEEKEGIKTNLHLTTLFALAVTLHNIPEGMAIGAAFGSVTKNISSLMTATTLAIGIGVQNVAEGAAVAMPIRCEGISCVRSFNYGQLSAVVEPIAALFTALMVTIFQPIMPYALAFAAGAMIYVVVEEVIPESQKHGNTDLATVSTLIGFILMMILDVAFT
jgi:ZIP family zinc transporter